MAMPQVHIVAYCTDLGYGPARGAEMLPLMFGTGIISRRSFGWIADRIGPAQPLLISSSLQPASLLAYFGANGLTSLYVITAMFGLVQGGIVPTYALIVRECYPPSGPAVGSAWCCRRRWPVWRSAAGCRVRSSTRRCRIASLSSTALPGIC
jgi:MFS family permease